MGRLALLLALLLPTDQPQGNDYDPSFHTDLSFFAESGLKEAYKSSIVISAFTEKANMSIGSGNYFHIHGHRFILTAAHVVVGFKDIYVNERSGDVYLAKVVHVDKFRDIAIIRTDRPLKYTKPVDYRASSRIEVGKEIFYCGHPNEMYYTVYHGRISGYSNQYLLADTFAWPGSSGSVVFDKSGKVAGVVSAISIDAPTGFPVLIPHFVRLGPTLNYTRRHILEVIMDGSTN